MDRAQYLARGTGHAPVGDQRHLQPARLQVRQHRRQAVQFGHAVGLGPLKTHDDDDILVELTIAIGVFHAFLIMEHADRGFDDVMLRLHGRDFGDRIAKVPRQTFQPARGLERVANGAHDLFVQRLGRACDPFDRAILELGVLGIARQPVARDGLDLVMQQAARHELTDHKAQAPRRVEVVHIGQAVRIDPRQQRRDIGKIREILPVQHDPTGPRHRDKVDQQVGRPARRMQADDAVHIGFFVQHIANGCVFIAQMADRQRPLRPRNGQRITQGRIGVHKGRAGQVQAHELHQHLVGVGGAIEGAGARPVVGRHL